MSKSFSPFLIFRCSSIVELYKQLRDPLRYWKVGFSMRHFPNSDGSIKFYGKLCVSFQHTRASIWDLSTCKLVASLDNIYLGCYFNIISEEIFVAASVEKTLKVFKVNYLTNTISSADLEKGVKVLDEWSEASSHYPYYVCLIEQNIWVWDVVENRLVMKNPVLKKVSRILVNRYGEVGITYGTSYMQVLISISKSSIPIFVKSKERISN